MDFPSNILSRILDIAIPRSCAGCKAPHEAFCAHCSEVSYSKWLGCVACGARNITGVLCPQTCRRKSPHALKAVVWAGIYDNELKEAIWQLKYKKRRELASPLGKLLIKKLENRSPIFIEKSNIDIIVPVPLHPLKEHQRGFNQARLIAEVLGKELDLPVVSNILRRIKNTAPQARTMNKDERKKNMQGAFVANFSPLKRRDNTLSQSSKAPTVLLVDDVATTGATVFDAARALQEAGAKYIFGATIAHG